MRVCIGPALQLLKNVKVHCRWGKVLPARNTTIPVSHRLRAQEARDSSISLNVPPRRFQNELECQLADQIQQATKNWALRAKYWLVRNNSPTFMSLTWRLSDLLCAASLQANDVTLSTKSSARSSKKSSTALSICSPGADFDNSSCDSKEVGKGGEKTSTRAPSSSFLE